MSAYSALAAHYDKLTYDVNYEAFADLYEALFKTSARPVHTVVDLGCGTGTLMRILTGRGYELIGVDSSEEMLALAYEKFPERAPLLIRQPMDKLDLYGTVDAVVSSLDGITYVKPERIGEVFHRVNLFLNPGGWFVFDINSPEKLKSLHGEMFLDETEGVYCVWRAHFRESENACVYQMDIFSKAGELWARSEEEHVEYAYDPEFLCKLLSETGFTQVRVLEDSARLRAIAGEGRFFITARKREESFWTR